MAHQNTTNYVYAGEPSTNITSASFVKPKPTTENSNVEQQIVYPSSAGGETNVSESNNIIVELIGSKIDDNTNTDGLHDLSKGKCKPTPKSSIEVNKYSEISEDSKGFKHETQDNDSVTDSSWQNNSNILRDCSYPSTPKDSEVRACESRFNIRAAASSLNNNLINIGDISQHSINADSAKIGSSFDSSTSATTTTTTPHSHPAVTQERSFETTRCKPGDSRRVRFKALLASSTIYESDEFVDVSQHELKTIDLDARPSNNSIYCDTNLDDNPHEDNLVNQDNLALIDNENPECRGIEEGHTDDSYDDDADYDEDQIHKLKSKRSNSLKLNGKRRQKSTNYPKSILLRHTFGRKVLNGLRSLGSINFTTFDSSCSSNSTKPTHLSHEVKDLLTGSSKYSSLGKRRRSVGRTFRGGYRYSRAAVNMAILKKLIALLFQRSTAALFGAFLIHVTLGTVYTLSNINSYLTSYMRMHGSPNATYGGSMWISSSYAVGQGFSMVLGGYIEKRFSARVACLLGCALHSISIISTSWSVKQGPLAVLVTYGLIPGFGCGLAYMTPMSNGFGWYPNRKGLVAGVILAGFGIGTFIFNMAQTAFVNPENLSPPEDGAGYFTQSSILDKVPDLFVFIGSIYAAMQFIGCCLLFKPPAYYNSDLTKSLNEPLVETEMSLKRAIHTREFVVLFLVYGITTQGVLFVNSMIKEYGQLFIGNDMYLAWTGSMASIANSMGRLVWGLAIDRFTFTQCFTTITIIFGSLLFLLPFKFVLSSKIGYLLCTLGIFGSFSGWMSTYPVHLSRVFGRTNSGMIYGLIFVSQSIGGIFMAFGTHYLIDHYNRFVPLFCMVFLQILGLSIYHLFYPKLS